MSTETSARARNNRIATYGERNHNAPSELDAFAFLIGKWEGVGKTKTPEGKFVEFAVTWIGRYILDGMAIADEFHSSAPDGSPYLGISFRQFDSAKKTWVVEYLSRRALPPNYPCGNGSLFAHCAAPFSTTRLSWLC